MEEDPESGPRSPPERRITERDDADGVPAVPLAAEERVGRYVIQSFLAEGGMGVVYTARDPELGRRVALKLVKTRGGADADLRERLLREAQAMAQLSHPNVIAVYDVGLHDDRVFIAMELIEGVALRQWLQPPRTWRATLRVLAAAGRGLAAAHGAGIVHRDFKPDNVIVGKDDRVCVGDFGLARAVDSTLPELAPPASPQSVSPDNVPTVTLPVADRRDASRERLEAHLTGAGTVIGTPAYMSPEHHRGELVTATSDQFSFCVAAWEALYGQRPFAVQADELRSAKERHQIVAPPRGRRVPARLRRILVRGLSPSPDARFSSMEDLLAALDRAARAPRRYAQAAAGVAVVAALAGALIWRRGPTSPCSDAHARARLAGAWEPPVADRIDRVLAGGGAETRQRVRQALDAYAQEWIAMRVDSCAATNERHEQSEEVLDLRTQCLDRRREGLRALTSLLAQAKDPEVQTKAIEAALSLPPVAECADVRALQRTGAAPTQLRERRAINAARAELEDVRALVSTGQYNAALERARRIVTSSRALGEPSLLAEALNVQAGIEEDLDQLEASLATAREAALAAGEAQDEYRLARVFLTMIRTLTRLARYPEALALRTPAESMIAAAGRQLSLRYLLDAAVGGVYVAQGDLARGIPILESAARLREEEVGPTSWRLAVALNNLGDALRIVGRNQEARQQFARALGITENALGSKHPNAGAILNNLAVVLEAEHHYEEALVMYQRSLAIDELTFGPRHLRVAISELNVGSYYLGLERHAEAQPHLERALEIYRGVLGSRHPDVAMALHNLGINRLGLGDPAGALERYREAVEIFEAALPAGNVNLAMPLGGMGDSLIALGRPAEALPYFERTLALQEGANGPEDPELAFSLEGLARARLGMGRPAAAIAPMERVLAIYVKHEVDPATNAAAKFLLARALSGAGRDRARAATLARDARDALAKVADRDDGGPAALLAEIDRWLAQRAGPP
ncbi:MAG: serine/threonine-protein kinase [Kofleriaceae bacterium]